VPSSPLPRIVAENMHDEATVQLWESDLFTEEEKLTLIKFVQVIKRAAAKEGQGRRGA
jgi:hypothetical protein